MRHALLGVTLLLAFGAAGCGGDGGKSAGTTTVTTTVADTGESSTSSTGTTSVTLHGKYKYPPVVINNFMQSCTAGNEMRRAYCECTLDQLSNSISVRDFARIGLAGGKLPPRINRIIRASALKCANKL